MRFISTQKRKIAALLLLILSINLFMPSVVYALTSGPAQPETKGFQPAGVSDMVDLQSGDFKYNIPLLDIDGYPINLNYQSGTSMDDEASWVGLGWSLSPGAINRQVRGLPDDFSGEGSDGDQVTVDHWTKPMVTIGGRVSSKTEVFGTGFIKGSGSLSLGVFKNNYTGIGAELTANAGISLTAANTGSMTAGLGITSNTQSGVDFSPYASLSVGEMTKDHMSNSMGLSASLGYNTRSGLKNLSLGATFTPEIKSEKKNYDVSLPGFGASLSYNTEPFNPHIQIPYKSTSSTYSIDAGPTAFGFYLSFGMTGYKNVREVLSPTQSNPAYGFLYAEKGKDNPNAMMDFIREKENPIIPELPNLAIPIHTPDLYSYSSQTGGGQFRLYRGGTGAFFDNQADDQSSNSTVGGDLGFGPTGWHAGVTFFKQDIHNTTHKWVNDNYFLPQNDFQNISTTDPNSEHVFFRLIGEKNQEEDDMASKLNYTNAVKVDVTGKTANNHFAGVGGAESEIKNVHRQRNKTVVSYLTANEAKFAATDQSILTYPVNQEGTFAPKTNYTLSATPHNRVDNDHKGHHISELSVTDDGGKRMIYGIPVYNLKQEEYSFAIGTEHYPDPTTGTILGDYTSVNNLTNDYNFTAGINRIGDGKGVDNYYHKESKTGYATSYLLTSILSPDYVDKTGDGITDDDQGTAIKFNYSKMDKPFKWRAPYQGATINRGLLADENDDKGNIIYGEKELWYINTIESKTKIAYFITEDRKDALGVDDWVKGGIGTDAKKLQRQRCLREIRLYSKADTKTPIKVIKFEYNYELCPGVPNFNDYEDISATHPVATSSGKLTLKKVWFEYGNISKGSSFPYKFNYAYDNVSDPYGKDTHPNPTYGYMLTDRWGVYKDPSENLLNLANDEFPYTNQNKAVTDVNVAAWHLKKIELPTGGAINVHYESDDYAYVQNRKAMCMNKIEALISGPDANNPDKNYQDLPANKLLQAHGIRMSIPTLPLPGEDHLRWFIKNYLNGSDYMYTKFKITVATDNYKNTDTKYDSDFIPCYAKVWKVMINTDSKGNNYAKIIFEDIDEGNVTVNPITIAAWQKMKIDYPRYAYAGYTSSIVDDGSSDLENAIGAMINAVGNISELFKTFYQKASDNDYAGNVDLGKSFARMTVNRKIGGGARVKMISITDNWNTMSGNQTSNQAVTGAYYGQSYDYTTTDNGQVISSGVATYEPSIGNDENPFKLPVTYVQRIKGAINNYLDLEEPFGESVFPAPTVTYSKVTVTDLADGALATNTPKTGYIVNEFYTSKDFPVHVNALTITPIHNRPFNYFSFVETTSDDELMMSQGYSVELNDMNGKSKSTRVFNQSGAQVSSTEYFYKSTATGSGEYTLNNNVKVVNSNGLVNDQFLGRDIEMFTDFREQETSNQGLNINLGIDVTTCFLIPIIMPHFPIALNDDYRLFRSACTFKVVQSYGLLDKVVKTDNGSSITTQNIAFDGLTGEALITKTQNEFNKNIYSVNIPAYWAYNGMSGAYQNLGVIMSGLTTNNSGEINQDYFNYFSKGDEIFETTTGEHYWVIEEIVGHNLPAYRIGNPINNLTGFSDKKYLIDRLGNIKTNFNPKGDLLVKVIRSGYRNMLKDDITSIVCLNNPIGADNKLQLASSGDLTTQLKVIKASATTYDENWYVEAPDPNLLKDPDDWGISKAQLFTPGDYDGAYYNTNNNNITVYNNDANSGGLGTGLFTPLSVDLSSRINLCSVVNNAIKYPPCILDDNLNIHIPTVFNVSAGDYFIGFGSTAGMSFTIDNTTLQQPTIKTVLKTKADGSPYLNRYQWILTGPVHLTAGPHTLVIQMNTAFPTGSGNVNTVPPNFGMEIYQNTLNDIKSGFPLKVVYTTRNLVDSTELKTYITDNNASTSHYYWNDGTIYAPGFTSPTGVNPYIYGFMGNWRPYQTKVFQEKRIYNAMTSASMNVKNAGYLNNFFSNWYAGSGGTWLENSYSSNWVTANTVTQYDKYGQQLENKDALSRFSAAKFDFNGELPSAVASNAMNHQIYANSFEDANFAPGSATSFVDLVKKREFISNGHLPFISTIDNTTSHTGNYSVLIPPDGGLTLSTIINNREQKTQPYLTFDALNRYTKDNSIIGLYTAGFEPSRGKQYVFNAWIKDGDDTHKIVDKLSLDVNFTSNTTNTTAPPSQSVALKCKAIVEGWKLVEGIIDLSSDQLIDGMLMDISLTVTGNVNIDDIRIHPYNSQMKTYAYDDKSMRLMAEMDENCFATLYEYDNEGLLVRVKKETERGIMTLKESRSSYKKGL